MVERFSARVADERGAEDRIKFINLSVAGATPRVWYNLLRELDPAGDRYRAIVLPIR